VSKFLWLPNKILHDTIIVKELTQISNGDVWGSVDSSYTSYSNIPALVQVLSEYDLRFMEVGEVRAGDIRVLLKEEYSTGKTIKVKDIVTYNNIDYEIFRIIPIKTHRGNILLYEAWGHPVVK